MTEYPKQNTHTLYISPPTHWKSDGLIYLVLPSAAAQLLWISSVSQGFIAQEKTCRVLACKDCTKSLLHNQSTEERERLKQGWQHLWSQHHSCLHGEHQHHWRQDGPVFRWFLYSSWQDLNHHGQVFHHPRCDHNLHGRLHHHTRQDNYLSGQSKF